MLTLIHGLNVLNWPDQLSDEFRMTFFQKDFFGNVLGQFHLLFSQKEMLQSELLIIYYYGESKPKQRICIVYSCINALHHSLDICKHGWLLPIANCYQ